MSYLDFIVLIISDLTFILRTMPNLEFIVLII